VKHPSKTVLLVDDDATLRKLMGRTLADGGHAVLTAADGQEALAVASTLGHQLGLVVTDIRMPEMDGLELANHLALLVPPPPVLFITGFAAAAATAIPGPVLEKPFSPDQLLKRVGLLLRLSTMEMPPPT
jgi:CheY-like chemotaxis protein